MNVLVIAPHPDDEAIGCGGTVIRHAQAGDRVQVVFLTSGERAFKDRPAEEVMDLREHEAGEAGGILGVEECHFLRLPDYGLGDDLDGACASLAPIVARLEPQRIYVPHDGEWHPDHRAACAIVSRVAQTRRLDAESVLTYEVWTPLTEFALVEDITAQMSRKLQAIRCYRSQLETFDYLRAATGLSQYRGALAARTDYAEVFGHPPGGDM